MGGATVPSTPAMQKRGEPWRDPGTLAAIEQIGRAARLDCSILFNFDEDYGYAGAGEQKRGDPWNTWSYDLASWASLFSYEPRVPVKKNEKPILIGAGTKDPTFPPPVMQALADAIAGPVELQFFEDAGHQLMLFETAAFSDAVHDFVLRQI